MSAIEVPPATGEPEVLQTTEELSLSDLWRDLMVRGDIVLEVDSVDVERIRKGLSGIKAKETAKLREAGMPDDSAILEFIVHTTTDLPDWNPSHARLEILLKRRAVVKVHKIYYPDTELM